MQDDEEGTSHGAEGEQALGEVGDALLDDMSAFELPLLGTTAVTFFVVGSGMDDLADAKGLSVEWCLWDEAVGERKA